ncbi:MAG: hypothetical protein ABS69_01025 [Nitrosomonadales bacterium SCN 54-20]|nr:MAG: hypothetical protein ABS69_01025 [Nitrosomonadales bacterium SCN 54-20]
MDDDTLNGITELEKVRNKRRLVNTLERLAQDAANGSLRCMAIRVFYKDGTSKLVVAGGTPEEQAALCGKLEEMEAKGRVLMEQLRPMVNEIFAHLPQEERQRVLDSPERLRLAMRTLPQQKIKLDPAILEQWTKYKALVDELLPLEQESQDE